MEILRGNASGLGSDKGAALIHLLYPDHLLFAVGNSRGQYTLRPFSMANTDEVLVLPKELAGIIPGTSLH
jgi:hypothetical protein